MALAPVPGHAEEAPSAVPPAIEAAVQAVNPRVIGWRRDIHQHPELGNRETRTAALVAAHLRALKFDEVRTGIAHTGVIGVLRGKYPGKVVALRADMDALPIKEATGLPFASTTVVDVDGTPTPVMHACGHDAHTAMLMGAAQVLAGMRDRIHGTVVFVFQPAEEGVKDQEAGAALMMKEGALDALKPEAIFGLHVEPGPVGRIDVRPGPFLSGSASIYIKLTGRQTHAGRPWEGTDLVNLSADIVKGLTTISARRFNVFEFPNVISIGAMQAGNRVNVLPGQASLEGTIRTFSEERRDAIKQQIGVLVNGLSASYGAEADVRFHDENLVTANDPALLAKVLPALRQAAGRAGVDTEALYRGAAEDFSAFEMKIPGVYYILGSTPHFTGKANAPTNHSDRFDIDEAVLPIGVTAHVLTVMRYLDPAL
ncbi:amidohydrolase [Novosphingobium sp. KA1]|uniref:amidohydrolase n=1 Tax=Novosphingobium sp. (strain KA1) TaxID=164608 RepID=UPI001F5D5337|nr:amidohydrolase [Novosphingobium sp. KA1]